MKTASSNKQELLHHKIVLKNGKPEEVILNWEDFQHLMGMVQDVYDINEIEKIKKEAADFNPLDDILNKYA